MALRPIVTIGDEILRKKAHRHRDFDAELHELLDDMLETMLHEQGIGLAAPQVAVSRRVIIVRLPDDAQAVEEFGSNAGTLYEAINPKAVKASREMVDGLEGCLSIPGYCGLVPRHASVVVHAQDRHGCDVRFKAHGWLARVFQHEIDHLDGILFIDRAKEVWKIGEHTAESDRLAC
jgi:peptide deformylase